MGKREHFMGSLPGCLVIIVAVLCVSANCQDSRDDSGIPLPIYDEGCSALMKALHREWVTSDGEIAFVVARKLIWALMLNPGAFYREFVPDTIYYQRFSDDLDALVFWNPNDTTTSHLEHLRTVAIERLTKETYSIDNDYLDFHNEMIEKLQNAKVTYVD